MIYTPIDNVTYGMINARNIYSERGLILVRENVSLTIGLITKLKYLGVTGLYIVDERFKDIFIENTVSQEVKISTLSSLADFMHIMKSDSQPDLSKVQTNLTSLIGDIIKNKDVIVSLTDIRTEQNQLLIHLLNVCIIASTLSTQLKFTKIQIHNIAMLALFHEFLDNPNFINNFQFNDETKKILQEYLKLSEKLKRLNNGLILQGNILKKRIADNFYYTCAEVIAIADYYDSLISRFQGGLTVLPHDACEILMAQSGTIFTQKIVIQFLKSIAVYPNGYTVKLNTDEIGIISKQNKTLPMRPVVRILHGDATLKQEKLDTKELNLVKEKTLFIKEVIV